MLGYPEAGGLSSCCDSLGTGSGMNHAVTGLPYCVSNRYMESLIRVSHLRIWHSHSGQSQPAIWSYW